jgi:uncharacterized protein YwgA
VFKSDTTEQIIAEAVISSVMKRRKEDGSIIISLLKMCDVVDALGEIPDRLALQKTIYLLQKMGLDFGYRFKWYTLGPYSSDLANDMFEGISTSILCANDDGYSDFRTCPKYIKLREKIPKQFSKETKELRNLTNTLRKRLSDSLFLECMASLLFLSKDRWPPIDSENDAFRELEKLKPKKFDPSTMNEAWQSLLELELV